jgi:RHS repeat-associated protein
MLRFAQHVARTIVAVFGIVALAAAARAAGPDLPPPPPYSAVDANSIDLTTLSARFSGGGISIGTPGAGGLSDSFYTTTFSDWRNTSQNTVSTADGTIYTVTLLGSSVRFTKSGSTFSPIDGQGGSFTFDGSIYTYTSHDGTVAVYNKLTSSYFTGGTISTITYPDGEKLTFSGAIVSNNLGYTLNYALACNPFEPCNPASSGITAINNAIDYCSPSSCTGLTQSWPVVTYSWGGVIDPAGQIWSAITDGYYAWGVRRMNSTGSLQRDIWYDYGLDGVIYDARNAATGTTIYSHSDSGDTRTVTATDGLGHSRVVTSKISTGQVLTDTVNPGTGNLTTTLTYDTSNRLTRVTQPEGNYTNYTYDSRGNVTEKRDVAKAGSGLSDLVTTATYPTTCDGTNYRICNKPTAIVDPRGNETDLTYDASHGGVLTITWPAVGGVRPQTRYTYTALYAWYKNSPSTIAQAATPVYKLTQISQCTTSASCSGAAEEVRTTIGYTAGSSSQATNLQPVTVTTASGNGSLSTTTTTAYDVFGNVSTVDGPLAGSGDTTRYRYDADHRVIGVVGPDPDGAGALKYPATRTTYDFEGRVSKVEQGYVNSQSDADWAAFTSLTAVTSAFDSVTGFKVSDTTSIGGTTQSIVQYAYDAAGRLNCTAVRVDSSFFGSLPDACTQTLEGWYGPDRITKGNYDNANRLTSVQAAYGSTSQKTVVTNSYTNNGKLAWIEDANGNRSSYTYDGFDRVSKLNYPNATTGSHSSNASDYEQYAYDANGNVTSLRLRSGDTIAFTYDVLNRLTEKDIPGGTSNDVYYGYDLLGRSLYAHFVSAGGSGVDYAYDALGQTTSENSYGRTLSYQYDLAGNRTRLTYPDSTYIQYTYDLLNRMNQVKLNGATQLAQFSYDNLGRTTAISRGNSTSTTYTYNSTSPNYTLAQDVAGTGQDLTLGYNFAPSGQLDTRTVSNNSYAYGTPSLSRSYTPDGLNRYASVAGTSYSYDGRGNLTSDGSRTFAYDLDNRLTTVSGSTSLTFAYDPLGRLRQTVSSTATTQFLYDGDDLIAEYDGAGNLLRRYVPGPNVDRPIIWYEGSATSSPNWYHADRLGSIVATSNASGTATIYSYGPSGEPGGGAWAGSRYRYTGQIAIPEVALYDFKARMYDPGIGRFLQTDAASYSGGPNLYSYAIDDPVNLVDPLGKNCEEADEIDNNGQWHVTIVACDPPPDTCPVFSLCGTGVSMGELDGPDPQNLLQPKSPAKPFGHPGSPKGLLFCQPYRPDIEAARVTHRQSEYVATAGTVVLAIGVVGAQATPVGWAGDIFGAATVVGGAFAVGGTVGTVGSSAYLAARGAPEGPDQLMRDSLGAASNLAMRGATDSELAGELTGHGFQGFYEAGNHSETKPFCPHK